MSTLDRLSDLAPERVRPLRRVEYEKLVEAGFFEDERLELIGGVIVERDQQTPQHDSAVMRLTSLFFRAVGERASVRILLGFAASDDSQSEPDVAIVPPDRYTEAHPSRAFLLVEVADTSLRKDRRVKAELYARAAVPEYWIVNLIERCIEVRTKPVDGAYTNLATFALGDVIPLDAFGATIAVSDVLR